MKFWICAKKSDQAVFSEHPVQWFILLGQACVPCMEVTEGPLKGSYSHVSKQQLEICQDRFRIDFLKVSLRKVSLQKVLLQKVSLQKVLIT